MPPWYIEKNIGIQHYKNDPSLSDEEIAKIAKWADSGAPRGNPADMPAPRVFQDGASWHAGEPDLIVESPEITVKANTPDWWGEFPPTKLPITEDRYVKSVEIREVNNFSNESGRQTVGQRYVWHHLIWATRSGERGGRSARRVGHRRRGRLAGARSRPQRRHLRRRRRPPAEGGLEHRLSVRAPPRGRPGRQVEAALRLQVPSRWLQAGAPDDAA